MKYALILNEKVFEIIESDTKPEFGPTPDLTPIFVVECGEQDVIDKFYNFETQEFYTHIIEEEELISDRPEKDYLLYPQEPVNKPSQLDNIEKNQMIIMDAIATQYEENVENQIIQMDVLATIYEMGLELQEGSVN